MVNRGSYKRLSMLYDRLGVERPVVAMVAGCKGSASMMLNTRQTCPDHGMYREELAKDLESSQQVVMRVMLCKGLAT